MAYIYIQQKTHQNMACYLVISLEWSVTTNMSYSIVTCLKKRANVYENEAKLNIFQADFTDKGETNLARTGTCKVVMHAASWLGWVLNGNWHFIFLHGSLFFFKAIKKKIIILN